LDEVETIEKLARGSDGSRRLSQAVSLALGKLVHGGELVGAVIVQLSVEELFQRLVASLR
jgi:hypothetical protein